MDTDKSKFKPPTWVGNLYQKFESICEDVDGIVCQGQDHVKYVGDQVQTVGESMKNFCSTVIQDLVIPLADKNDFIATQVYSKKDEIQSAFFKRDASKSSSMEQVEAFEKIDPAIDTKPLEKEADAISIRTNDNQLFNASSPANDCVPASALSPRKMEESPLHFQQDENNAVIDGLLEEKSPLELSGSVFTGENDASSCVEIEREASECWESDIEFDDSGSHLFEEDEDQVNESPLEENSSPSEVMDPVFTCINYASSCVNNEPSSCRDIEHRCLASEPNQLEKIQINSGSSDDKSSSLELSEFVLTCLNYASSFTNIQHEPSLCRESDVEHKQHTSDSHKLENNQVIEDSLEEESLPSEELELAYSRVNYESSSTNSGHETSPCRGSDIELGEFASDSHQHEKDEVHEGSLEKKLSQSEELESAFTCTNNASFCAKSEHEPSSCSKSDIVLNGHPSDSHQHLKNQVNEDPLEEKSSPSAVLESVFTCISCASSSPDSEHEPPSCRESDMELSDCTLDSNQLVNWENQTSEGHLDNKSSLQLSETVFTGVCDAYFPPSNVHDILSCTESVIDFDDSALYSHQQERNEANEGSSEEKLSPSAFSESVVTSVTDASSCANSEHVASLYNESDIEFDESNLAVVGTPDNLVDGSTETLMETISLQDEVKHPASNCAIEDSYVFGAVSHTAKNFRSYKKKIRDAFTSKRRLVKEYKHLGILYGDIDAEIESSLSTARRSLPSVHVNSLESNEAPNEELYDWELL